MAAHREKCATKPLIKSLVSKEWKHRTINEAWVHQKHSACYVRVYENGDTTTLLQMHCLVLE